MSKARPALLLCASPCVAGAPRPAFGQKGAPPARAPKLTDGGAAPPFAFRRSAPGEPYLTRPREDVVYTNSPRSFDDPPR